MSGLEDLQNRPDVELRARQIRRQIEHAQKLGRENPNLDNTTLLRKLGKEHYDLTGAGGGA